MPGSREFRQASYAYLLGLYLGDGCITEMPRTFKLRVFLDSSYPVIVSECATAMVEVCPGRPAWIGARAGMRCTEVAVHWNHWPCVFPQHGAGRKHRRPIRLVEWQEEIVSACPRELLRGLIHSDGCRIVAQDRGRPSVRYHFSNRSEDIKRIYTDALDRLGVRWTRPCDRQIATYRKASVAILDEFIGPKA